MNIERLFILILLLVVVSCSTTQYLPVETIEKIEYRDSLIFVNDTVTIEVPKEKIVYVGPADTLSQISTSLAKSEAKIEQGTLTHTLEQKGEIKAKIDTFFVVEYIDRIVEREIPVEVEKEVKYTPDWVWYNLIYSIVLTLIVGFSVYLKFKK